MLGAVFRSPVGRGANHLLHKLEARQYRARRPPQLIFIVGPPRSGTTLLYQVLVNALDVGYITNRHARFYGGISFYESTFRTARSWYPSSYTSQHGRTGKPNEPSECGEYWYQFFPRHPVYTPLDAFPPRSRDELTSSLARIENAFQKPVLFKNVMNSARLQVLSHLFPSAFFIVVQRSLIANAYSIIEAKQRAIGNTNRWWSLEPLGCEFYRNASAALQAVQQVRLTHRMISNDIRSHLPDNVLSVPYERLCDAPNATMNELLVRLRCTLKQIGVRNSYDLPDAFRRRTEADIPAEMRQRLVAAAEGVSFER